MTDIKFETPKQAPSQHAIYKPPTKGILSHLPASWVPYAELMRIDKPAGIYAFSVPCILGLLLGGCLALPLITNQFTPVSSDGRTHDSFTKPPRFPDPHPLHLLYLAAVFLPGCFLLRSAACAWNDLIDAPFDRLVTRTRLRPIARYAVSPPAAILFVEALAIIGLPLLLLLPFNSAKHALGVTILAAIYPFAKRVTDFPQVVLGATFGWCVVMSLEAVVSMREEGFLKEGLVLASVMVVWNIANDTIYAHQDIADDVKAGVKSMSVRFADSTKTLTGFLAVVQVALLGYLGWLGGFGVLYYVGTCGGTALTMRALIRGVDLKRPESCAEWFRWQFRYVGAGMASGFLAEYVSRWTRT